ncbi:hypothetical protein O8B93_06720 [Agrobacterium rhizogenes]|uniref:hypothetical protein n=1 Tax=Rhizobium rhizogenes TaxID=359 RepID=UPI0022B610F8|nr:hypothetical protein [Rhizobium rhizogenes]MCZ7447278.1 hypothetical protein [Rhizobium rhizogenes]
MNSQSRAELSRASSMQIHARSVSNNVCTVVEGQTYKLVASGKWWDWFIRCGPDGYSSTLLNPVAHLKCAPNEKWFCLMGAINCDPESVFRIGSARIWTATRSGMLNCFANDIPAMRWNNWGSISIEVQTV